MKKLILIIISALTALTLCACGQEETPAEPTPVPTLEFASGSYPVDAESLRIVVTADEMPRMDEFTALKAVDFTGSDCYEAIGEYIASHSGVRVSLRGEFPNGGELLPAQHRGEASRYRAGEYRRVHGDPAAHPGA